MLSAVEIFKFFVSDHLNPVNTHNSAVNPGCFVPCNTGRGEGGFKSLSVFAKLHKLENSNLAR